MHNLLKLSYKGAHFFSFIMKAGSHMYKVIYMKRIKNHSFSLPLTNIYGMLEIMKSNSSGMTYKDLE